MKSIRSYRGSLPNHAELSELRYESRLERNIFAVLLASACFRFLREQPPYVTYVGPDGTSTKHWFDLVGVEPNGRRVAIDVKPLGSSKMPGLVAAHRLIEAQVGSTFADEYRILTEEHAHPDDVADARLILRARRLPDAAADEAVARIVSTLNGATPIRPLVAATGLKAAAFNALVRLIGERKACVYDDARISYGAWVSRAEHA